MEQLEFKDWWDDFQSYHKFDKDGGVDEIKHLKAVVSEFSNNKKTVIIDEFILNGMFVHACELIQLYGNENQKEVIRIKFSDYIVSKSNNSIGQDFLMTILNTFDNSDLELLEEYFSEQRSNWFRVPTKLFEVNKNLFLKSFELLLNRTNEDILYESDGFLYLTNSIEILRFLIDNLSFKQSIRIKEFCRVKSNHSYVNTDNWKKELLKIAE